MSVPSVIARLFFRKCAAKDNKQTNRQLRRLPIQRHTIKSKSAHRTPKVHRRHSWHVLPLLANNRSQFVNYPSAAQSANRMKKHRARLYNYTTIRARLVQPLLVTSALPAAITAHHAIMPRHTHQLIYYLNPKPIFRPVRISVHVRCSCVHFGLGHILMCDIFMFGG